MLTVRVVRRYTQYTRDIHTTDNANGMINKDNLKTGRRADRRWRPTPHSKLEAIGISTGLLDRHGKEIVTGDKVLLTNSSIDGIVLYNRYAGSFGVFYSYSMWYGDNPYNPDSYGKYISIPADNGMRMEIEILTTKDEED